jgi:hypothetical protein
MPTMTEPRTTARLGTLDADDVRGILRRGMERGEVFRPGQARPVAKEGVAAAKLGGIRTVWMDISPELAKQWLENNFCNRPVSKDVIVAFARDMMLDEWFATHQGVAFNDKDELIDGQQRLHAIIMSGKTVRMMVTFGLPSKIAGKEVTTMDCVDRGRTRSVADQLTIQHGLKNASITASVCASLGSLCYGERTRRLSVGQTLEIFRAFESPVTWVTMHRSKEHGLKTAGVLAAFAFALATETEDLWAGSTPFQVMYDGLMDGKKLRERFPMKHLRNFLTSDDAKLLTRGTDRGVAELVLQAIHLEGKGKPISVLTMSTDGITHFRGLQKERAAKIGELFKLPTVKAKAA